MRIHRGMVAVSFCALIGCGGAGGGDADGSNDADGGGGGGDDVDAAGGGGVAGVAHVVQGATPPPAFALNTGVATDGKWYVSPDRLAITLTRVNFAGETPESGTGADLVDCVVTYDRAGDTLDELLDCPFSIAPGTYLGINVFVDSTVEVFIDDAVNGIFTDPGSETGVSSTEPEVHAVEAHEGTIRRARASAGAPSLLLPRDRPTRPRRCVGYGACQAT